MKESLDALLVTNLLLSILPKSRLMWPKMKMKMNMGALDTLIHEEKIVFQVGK